MKRLFLIGMGLFTAAMLTAQSPQAFNYQAVVRDATGTVMAKQDVHFRISILKGSTTGDVVFSETQKAKTNEFGLVTLEIGRGTSLKGDLKEVKWGENEHFLQVEVDPTGGESFILMGTSQLLSVPYALHAWTSETGDNWGSQSVMTDPTLTGKGTQAAPLRIADNAITSTKIASMGATAGQVLKWNGQTWVPSGDLSGLTLPYEGTVSHTDYAFKLTNSNISGLYAHSTGLTGTTFGISGRADSPGGRGIWGLANSPTGSTIGVGGATLSSSGIALYGMAPSTTGTTYGVYSEISSPGGYSGYFKGGRFYVEGKLGIADSSPEADLDVEGDVKIGRSGINFLEIREITGVTAERLDPPTSVEYPSGYNKSNTRVLSLEIDHGLFGWHGLGYATSGGTGRVTYSLGNYDITLYHPYDISYLSRPFRMLLMRVAD